MKVIEVKKDLKYREKIENYEYFENSFHSDVYKKAWQNFKDIYDNYINIENKKKENTNIKEYNDNNLLEQDNENRIIAFVGDRGTGKSSTMFSFAKALSNNNYLKQQDPEISKIIFEQIAIDPSFFEDNENIIELIVAKLFKKLKITISKSNIKDNYNGKRELLVVFEEVYRNIKTIEKKEKFIENDEIVEQISNLASSSKLRDNLLNLFTKFLDFCYPDEIGNKFLLLIIDDFDLNIKHGNEMAEHIRKYLLNIPNLVILVSLNFDDLKDLIDKGNAEILEVILKNKFVTSENISPKSIKYLEKFIPYPRRIFMPEIQRYKDTIKLILDMETEKNIYEVTLNKLLTQELVYINKKQSIQSDIINELSNKIINLINQSKDPKNLKQIYLKEITDFFHTNRINAKNKESFQSKLETILEIKLEEKLLKLIYFKTGLILFENEGRNITLVPNTLRELRNFIFFLIDLEDSNYSKNTSDFEKYILENWVGINV